MLEEIEWTRYWREEATSSQKRILIIGDSIMDGSKREVHKYLNGRYMVSCCATSKALDNAFYLDDITLLAKQENFDYKYIYFNNGIHTGNQTVEQYKANYKKTIQSLQQLIPNAKIILGLSTPMTIRKADPKNFDTPLCDNNEVSYDEKNNVIVEFNEVVKSIATEMSLEYFDLYSKVDKNTSIQRGDGVHYNATGMEYIGKIIAEKILSL